MDVLIEKTGRKVKIKFCGKARDLLSKLKINPETVIVARDGALVSEDEELIEKDTVKIISVISGG